jgi:hypothetical protein
MSSSLSSILNTTTVQPHIVINDSEPSNEASVEQLRRLTRSQSNTNNDVTVKVADEPFDVETILKKRKKRNKDEQQYYVKWLGYDESYNLWVDESELIVNCKDIIDKFNQQRSNKRRRGPSNNHNANTSDEMNRNDNINVITNRQRQTSNYDLAQQNEFLHNNLSRTLSILQNVFTGGRINPIRTMDTSGAIMHGIPSRSNILALNGSLAPSVVGPMTNVNRTLSAVGGTSNKCSVQFNKLPESIVFNHNNWIPVNLSPQLIEYIKLPLPKHIIKNKSVQFSTDEQYSIFVDYILIAKKFYLADAGIQQQLSGVREESIKQYNNIRGLKRSVNSKD